MRNLVAIAAAVMVVIAIWPSGGVAGPWVARAEALAWLAIATGAIVPYLGLSTTVGIGLLAIVTAVGLVEAARFGLRKWRDSA